MKNKILILGGTEFVGRQLVEQLLAEDHYEIYLFNRGKTNPDLFPQAISIVGDRETTDVEQIKNEQWDYVVDFSSYYPKSLRTTINQLNRNVKRYIYISTISVYSLKNYDSTFCIEEDYEQKGCTAEQAVDTSMKTYGERKVACEQVLAETEWLNTTILRPSIIYGKYDPTDRFYYWLRRIKHQEQILLPDHGKYRLSLTFADDLVKIIQTCLAEELLNGVYNCITNDHLELSQMLETTKMLLGSSCEFVGIDAQKLKEKNIRLPLTFSGHLMIDGTRLSERIDWAFTPFEESIRAVIDHYEAEDWRACKIKLDHEVEKELLKAL